MAKKLAVLNLELSSDQTNLTKHYLKFLILKTTDYFEAEIIPTYCNYAFNLQMLILTKTAGQI